MPRILTLLLGVGDDGGNLSGSRGGKSEEVEHVVSGAPMTW